jgi:hypothetical protein
MKIAIVEAFTPEGRETQIEITDIPLPETFYRMLGIANRATFFRWEKLGLKILRVNGQRFIYPADLRTFMERNNLTRGSLQERAS